MKTQIFNTNISLKRLILIFFSFILLQKNYIFDLKVFKIFSLSLNTLIEYLIFLKVKTVMYFVKFENNNNN